MRIAAGMLLAAFLLIVGWLVADERTRLTLFQPNGVLRSGNALGISIGEERGPARKRLERGGMLFQRAEVGGTCFFRNVAPDQMLDVFFVTSWHGGMVCIVSRYERVEELIWAFQPSSL